MTTGIRNIASGGVTILRGAARASFVRDGKVVGSARRSQRTWLLSIPGHQWDVTPDMPAARFWRVPGGAALKKISVKGFASLQACAKEINRVSPTTSEAGNA